MIILKWPSGRGFNISIFIKMMTSTNPIRAQLTSMTDMRNERRVTVAVNKTVDATYCTQYKNAEQFACNLVTDPKQLLPTQQTWNNYSQSETEWILNCPWTFYSFKQKITATAQRKIMATKVTHYIQRRTASPPACWLPTTVGLKVDDLIYLLHIFVPANCDWCSHPLIKY